MAYVQYSQTLLQGASQDRIVLLHVAITCNNRGYKNMHHHIVKGNVCCNKEKKIYVEIMTCLLVPVTTAWRVLRLRMEERPPIWRVAANKLNKQSCTAEKGWSSSLGVGRGANNSSP